ncbi:MAG TPA: hypothetical protein VMW27_26665 [Thermoanaerobaculia bacterium]|nr:hypothetical protein [Thermoanaerobaculia bacterium]
MASSLVGNWNTAWTGGTSSAAQLTINTDGSGTYNLPQSGQGNLSNATFGEGGLSLSGTWTQYSSSGTFTFVLVGDQTFIGVWNSTTGEQSGQWNGTTN